MSRGFGGLNSLMQLYDGAQLFVASGTLTFPFDTWNAERIEFLGGPASVMYGNGAIGGVWTAGCGFFGIGFAFIPQSATRNLERLARRGG